MNNGVKQFLRLSWPFLVGGGLLCLNLWAGTIANLGPKVEIKIPLGVITLPITTTIAVRLLLTACAFYCFLIPVSRNYSSIFPRRLDMVVFFDDSGIERVLDEFSPEERRSLKISSDWKTKKAKYFETIELKLTKPGNDIPAPPQFRFRDPKSHVFSRGETTFVVKQVALGLQQYRIASSHGSVEHVSEKEGCPEYKFSSEFDLIEGPSNWINIRRRDIYLPTGWTCVLCPRFKQTFRNNLGRVCWDHTLTAATKITYFPFPSIGRTLYLHEPDGDSSRVPIGYAIYDTE